MIALRRPATRVAGESYRRACARLSALLPSRLSRVVSGQLIGYAVVNGATFGLDLIVLTVLRDGLGWAVPVAFTVGYGIALATNFALQRRLNFPAHGRVGAEAFRYAVTVVLNYVLMLLALGSGLTAAGVPYQLARVVAAGGEAVFLYCALRWFVFRQQRPGRRVSDRESSSWCMVRVRR